VHDRRWLTLGVLCVSLLVIVIDNTIVNVALPSLVRELGSSVRDLQWVVDAYSLVFAGLLLTAGSLGDRFGRKGALMSGLAVFGTASFAAAMASGVTQLVAMRAVMGIGAALIMPTTLSILTNVFTDARERAVAIGIWAGVAGVAIALGPVAGGFLLDHFWWGSVFMVNVPIVAGTLVAARWLVPSSRSARPQRIDVLGAVLSIVGLVALVWSIIEGPTKGWTSTPILAGFALAAVALTAFVLWERHVDEPMLDVRFFSNPRFTAASLTIALQFLALFGFVFLATQYLQFVLGYTPFGAGVRTLPFAAMMMVFAPTSSRLVARFGTKRVVTVGMLLFTAGLVVASTATATSGYGRIAIAMVLLGTGMGLAVAPATDSIMGSLPPDKAGVGSAVNDTTREVGGAVGVAVVGSLLSSFYGTHLDRALPKGVPGAARVAAGDSVGAALEVSRHAGAAGSAIAGAARDAFVFGMSRASLVTAAIALVGAFVAWRFLPARAAEADAAADEQVPVAATAVAADAAAGVELGEPPVSRPRPGRRGTPRPFHPVRSSRSGSSPGTAGGSPPRSRRSAPTAPPS
jgi:EmrB/QacA subfamily drug resistance transporter